MCANWYEHCSQEIVKRRDAPARGRMNLDQTETFHFVTATALRSMKRARLSLPHMSTAGRIIGPMGFPDLKNPTSTWHLAIGDKKKLYGNARLLPGGPTPDGGVPGDNKAEGKRTDKTIEPVTFHGSSVQLLEELLYQVAPFGKWDVGQGNVKAVIDGSAGDGTLATVCLKHGIPYLGVTQNEFHREMLMKRLSQQVFQLYLDDKSPLHDATLCSLLNKSTKVATTSTETKDSEAAAASASKEADSSKVPNVGGGTDSGSAGSSCVYMYICVYGYPITLQWAS